MKINVLLDSQPENWGRVDTLIYSLSVRRKNAFRESDGLTTAPTLQDWSRHRPSIVHSRTGYGAVHFATNPGELLVEAHRLSGRFQKFWKQEEREIASPAVWHGE